MLDATFLCSAPHCCDAVLGVVVTVIKVGLQHWLGLAWLDQQLCQKTQNVLLYGDLVSSHIKCKQK